MEQLDSLYMAAEISIHPPREGWDRRQGYRLPSERNISIHPPREGWDWPNGL